MASLSADQPCLSSFDRSKEAKTPKASTPAPDPPDLGPQEAPQPPPDDSDLHFRLKHPLSAHAVVLVRAAVGWSETEQLEQLFRLPVIGFFTDAGDMGAFGTCQAVGTHEREKMARSIYDLYEMVASPNVPKDIGAFVEERINLLRQELSRFERAHRADNDSRRLDAADAIRHEAELLAFTLRTRDATIDEE